MATRRSHSKRHRDQAVIAELLSKGWTYPAIAAHLGVSVRTVRRDAAIAPPHPTLKPEIRATGTDATIVSTNVRRLVRKGRVSRDREDTRAGFSNVVPPRYTDQFSRVFNMIEDWRLLKDPASIVLLLARHSPEFSKAWWDYLLLSVSGYEIKAKQATDKSLDDEVAQVALDAMLERIGDLHGSLHNLFTQVFTNGFFRGAFAAEIVLQPGSADLVVDIAPIDPATIRFRPVTDPVRGDIWEMGQQQGSTKTWVSLDIPTIKYLPIHPLPSDPPYGTPPVAAAAMPAIFLLGMFYDIKRVLEKQGFGRLDVTVFPTMIVEKLGSSPTAEAKRQAVEDYFDEVGALMEELDPDDVFVHTDDSVVNRAPGAGGEGGSLAGVDRLIEVMERQLVKSLKSTPLIQGITDGVSEANANRQWEIYARGIKALQQYVENLFGYLFKIGLAAEGINALVEVRFAEIRAVDEYREAQTRMLKTQTAILWETAQYEDADGAAEYANGRHGIPDSLRAKREEVGAPTKAPTINPAAPEANNPDAKAENDRAEPVVPELDGDNLGPVPDGKPTPREIEQATAWFKETVPLGANVLNADPVGEE